MPRPAVRAVVAYNSARLGLLAACLLLGAVAGLRGFLLLIVALVVSGVLSYLLLARLRVAMGEAVATSVRRGRARLADRVAREDAYVDEVLDARHTAGSDGAGAGRARP